MKRFIALIALVGVVGVSFGAVPQSSSETGYVPKPTFKITKSPEIPPGYELKLRGLEQITWINEGDVPCHITFLSGSTTFSVECDGANPMQGDLSIFPPLEGKEYQIRIKLK